jgi:hypothetical protein
MPSQRATDNLPVEVGSGAYRAVFLCGEKMMIVNFENKLLFEAYSSLLDRIRSDNKAIIDDGGWNGLPPETFKRRMMDWLRLCSLLKNKWGPEYVPPDVDHAWADGERVLQIMERNATAAHAPSVASGAVPPLVNHRQASDKVGNHSQPADKATSLNPDVVPSSNAN